MTDPTRVLNCRGNISCKYGMTADEDSNDAATRSFFPNLFRLRQLNRFTENFKIV
jgi:hypothetical protein